MQLLAELKAVVAPPRSQRFRYALHKSLWFVSELLGAYNHDFFESKSLKDALQRNLARTSVWAPCRVVGTCTWALSQRWLMSDLGEKPPQVKGYLPGDQAEIRNSLFMSPFFKMMWDWFSLCLHVLHSSPWLKSISSIDFDGFALGQEGDSGSLQPAYVLSSVSMRQICERMPPVAGLFDLVLPDARSALIRYIV